MARNYKVGRGKPPKAGRFKKGHSGNPKGRPRGSRNLATELNEELKEFITVREAGKERRVTKGRAVVKSLFSKSMKGDVRASTAVMALSERLEKDATPASDEPLAGDELEILRRLLPSLQNLAAKKGEYDDH